MQIFDHSLTNSIRLLSKVAKKVDGVNPVNATFSFCILDKKDSEKAEIFRKIEPYLTFLNIHQLERQGADIQSKVEQLEQLNQSMRDRDKMKDDAIAHLSDQLIALTTRLDSIERRQQ